MMRRTAGLAVGAGLTEGAALALLTDILVPRAGLEALLGVALVGATGLAVPIMTAGFVLYEVRENGRRTQKLVQIRSVMGSIPLPVGGWAMDAELGSLIVQTIHDRRPRLIVECGSGTSTVLTASVLREIGAGKIISLEHDAEYAEKTRRYLRERGLDAWAEVIIAPLVMRDVDGEERRWYDVDVAARIPGMIDMLVIDGPPRRSSTLARYPAVPLLRDRLAPGCVIILDDGNRPDERTIARLWAGLIGGKTHHAPDGKGAWVFELPLH